MNSIGGRRHTPWLFLLVLVLLALGLGATASGTFAAAPTGAPVTKAPVVGPSAGKTVPAVPNTCGTNYGYTTSTGNAIDPGTLLIPGTQADDAVVTIPLPFTYYHYGIAENSVGVSTNGNLQFGGIITTFTNSCPLPTATFTDAIMPHWDDLIATVAVCGAGCGTYTSTVGVSPNRIFNIEWRSCLYNAGACGGTVNFEARLYEALGPGMESTFEFIYAGVTNNGVSASIGVQKTTGGSQFSQFSCNTASLSSGLKITWTQNCTGPTFTPTLPPTQTFTPTATPTFCATSTPINEGFEGGTLGQFSSVVPTCVPGGCGWVITSTAHSGVGAAFAPDGSNISDQQLVTTSPFLIPGTAGGAILSFYQKYDMETGYDGGVIEVSTDGGTTWLTPTISTGGYNGTISTCCLNPLAGRPAWTGSQPITYTQVVVGLAAYIGQSVLFRFREGTDSSIAHVGWWIDDVLVTIGQSNCGPSPTGTLPTDTPTFTPTNTFTPTITPTFTPAPPTNSPTGTSTLTPSPSCTPQGYTWSASAGATIVPGVNDIGNNCDDCTTSITLPFAFNFYGVPFTGANVSSNGTLQFNSANATFSNLCLPQATFNYAIFPHWDDLQTDITGTVASGIFTDVQGVAGSQVFIIEWRAVYFATTTSLNFEVKLYEGAAGSFDVVYGVIPNGGISATVGSQSDTGSLFTLVECNTGGLSAGQLLQFVYHSTGNCPTNTPTNIPTITDTPTITPTFTPAPPTNTPTVTNTATVSPTPTATACSAATIFSEGFESGLGQFTSVVATCVPGGCGWVITSTAHSGVGAAFAPDLANISDQYLQTTNPIAIPSSAAIAQLRFWHYYNLESTFDGGVVEVSTDGGTTWITSTTFLQNGYNATISTGFLSPIAGRSAFSGNSGGYIFSIMNLAAYAGQSIKIRFREANDDSVAATGWFIDDVTVETDAPCTPTATPTNTPAVTPMLVAHVTFQNISQPSVRMITEAVTLILKSTFNGSDSPTISVYTYTGFTDASGFFTAGVGTLPGGVYNVRFKGAKNLSTCVLGVNLTGATQTNAEMGTSKGGDANNTDIVNAQDFTILAASFGKSFGQPGYDARADFDQSDIVNSTDFVILAGNFQFQGCTLP